MEITQFANKKSLKQITDPEYSEVLDELASKRLKALVHCSPLEKKQKLSSYLLYRGWENDLVYEKTRELLD